MKQRLIGRVRTIQRGDRFAVIFLTVVSIATHLQWLFNFKVFTSGDWQFVSQEKYHDFANLSPIWYSDGFGGTSATPAFYLIRFFEGILTYVGSNFILNEKLFFFIPIIFGATLGTYIFLRQYFKPLPAMVGSIVFAFNTAMLFNYAGALTIAVVNSLAPLFLYLFRQYIAKPESKKLLILAALLMSAMIAYELRISIIVIALAGGLLLYTALGDDDKKDYVLSRIWPLFQLGGLIILLHLFWLIPYIIGSRQGVTFSDSLGQSLFISFSDMQNALTLHHPFWTNARPARFIIQPIPWYFWLVPIVVFSGFLFDWRKDAHREIGFWALIGIVGLFLVKQVNQPIEGAYPWIFEHVPGFAAYRESSKFYLLVALSYTVLVPFALTRLRIYLWRLHAGKQLFGYSAPHALWWSLSAALILLFMINALPLINGSFRTTYIPRHMPADYARLNQFIASQEEFFRVLWLPANSRWGAQSGLHPVMAGVNMGQGVWLRSLGSPVAGVSNTSRDKSVNIFKGSSSDDMLDASSIKYVVVPLRDTSNEDDFFQYYGDDRDYYIDTLDTIAYLQRIDIGAPNIAIYENKNFRPHVGAFRNAQSLDVEPGDSLEGYHSFITGPLGAGFNFVTRTKKQPEKFPHVAVDDVFGQLDNRDIKQGGVSKTFSPSNSPALYYDPGKSEINYSIDNAILTMTSRPYDQLLVNSRKSESGSIPRQLAQRQLAPLTPHYLQSGDQIKALNIEPTRGIAGTSDKPVAVYSAATTNRLSNGSFEKDLWQKRVSDCNAYDQGAIISAESDAFANHGKQSLRLDAQKHTACMTAEPVSNSHRYYLLSFDHYLDGGQMLGYEINFRDKQIPKMRYDIRGSRQWQKEQIIVEMPRKATDFRLTLKAYPDYRQVKYTSAYFDNVQIVPLNKIIDIPAMTTKEFEKIELPKNTPLTFSYARPGLDAQKNVLANGDFSQGLWQKQVADCNNFDDNPMIGMKLVNHDDRQALELTARRHAACTSKTDIPINESSSYLLQFKYQASNAKSANYTIYFNDSKRTTLSGSVDAKTKRWEEFAKQIDTPLGATKMALTVYAYGTDTGAITVVNRYADFRLHRLPVRAYSFFLVNDDNSSNNLPENISHDYISTTKTSIHIRKANAPFFINLSNSYNPLWRLLLDDRASQAGINKYLPWADFSAVDEKGHFSVNDFQNAWYVDPQQICNQEPEGCSRNPDGSYDIVLMAEFFPQRWFYVSAAVSTGVAVLCVAYLLYRPIRRRRQAKAKIWRATR